MRFTIMLADSKTGQLINGFGGTADELQDTRHFIDGEAEIAGVIGIDTTNLEIYRPSYHVQGVVGEYPKNVRHYKLYIY